MLSDATNGGLVETPTTRRKKAKKVNKRVGLRTVRGGKGDGGGGASRLVSCVSPVVTHACLWRWRKVERDRGEECGAILFLKLSSVCSLASVLCCFYGAYAVLVVFSFAGFGSQIFFGVLMVRRRGDIVRPRLASFVCGRVFTLGTAKTRHYLAVVVVD